LNRGRHLYSAARPSRWALAHISSSIIPPRYCQFLSVGKFNAFNQSLYDFLTILELTLSLWLSSELGPILSGTQTGTAILQTD